MTTVRHVDDFETPGEVLGRLAAEHMTKEAAPPKREGRVELYGRVGYSLLVGLGLGFQFSGYLVWAQGVKTPEAGWVAIITTVLVTLLVLWATRKKV